MSNLVRLPQAAHRAPRPSPTDHAPEAEAETLFALGLEQGLEGALPPAESAPVQDRRGPMRPGRLSPTRRRLQGQAYAWAFQAVDGLYLLVIGLVAFVVGPGPAGVYAAPALAVMISLSLFETYGFRSRQGLAYHLAQTSVAAAVGVLTAVALLSVFLPLRGVPVLGDTQALLDHRIMPYVDRVIVAVPTGARDRVRQVIATLRPLPNEISLLLEDEIAPVDAVATRRTQTISDLPLARISGPPGHLGRAITKRSLDLVVGLAALVLALPIMALIALVIRLDSPGPILFRQRRQGFNNEEIVVWKFRSMRHDLADARARQQVQADDVRVTRVGRFIRRTSLDELPQIFNVLTGEMSLVGPRPHAIGMMTGDVESARLVAEYAHRHRMKPGMTGWAAIHGSRGPVDTPADVRRRIQLDIEYIERQSIWLDLYIIAMTIPCLLGDRQTVR